jgi:hypothetical protein
MKTKNAVGFELPIVTICKNQYYSLYKRENSKNAK